MKRVLFLLALPPLVVMADAAAFHARNRNNGSLVSGGEKRQYLLHVPRGYDRSRPAPLVISMHGGGGWPALQRDVSRWNRLADQHGFLVVYPWAARSGGGPAGWGERDIPFIADLIDHLQSSYAIDASRIYADGLSNGGGMAFMLSCRLPERIAAVGMVAAAHTKPWSWCGDDRPVPMIAFHGTADTIVRYGGGESWVTSKVFPAIPAWTASWARRNRCKGRPVESAIAADVTRREFTNCDAPVVLYTIRGGGHTWPGGAPLPEWFVGPTSDGVDATAETWAFFSR